MTSKFRLLAAGVFLAAVTARSAEPFITTQPQDQTNFVGTTATFSVEATGTEPLAYQWQKLSGNWSDLLDRTNTALVLTNVQTSDASDYRVVVTNVDGVASSTSAHLYVVVPATLQFATTPYTVAENGRGGHAHRPATERYQFRCNGILRHHQRDGHRRFGLHRHQRHVDLCRRRNQPDPHCAHPQ